MALIARYSAQAPGKQKMSRDQLIGLIQSDAKFMCVGGLVGKPAHGGQLMVLAASLRDSRCIL
jgi:hypothetical protein